MNEERELELSDVGRELDLDEAGQHMISCLGVPREFLTGGTNYSTCEASLRYLERRRKVDEEEAARVFKTHVLVPLWMYMDWGMRATLAGFTGRWPEAVQGLRLLAEHFKDWSHR